MSNLPAVSVYSVRELNQDWAVTSSAVVHSMNLIYFRILA
jgi:hypothetical protein